MEEHNIGKGLTKFNLEFYKNWEKQKTLDLFKNLNEDFDADNENVKLWNKLRDER